MNLRVCNSHGLSMERKGHGFCEVTGCMQGADTAGPLYPWVPPLWIQPTADKTYIFFKCYVVADVYCVIRPMKIALVLIIQLFFLSLFPKEYSITPIYTALTLC